MWKQAIEDTVSKTRRNIERNGERFPHITAGNRYSWYGHNDWIEGFYTGLTWLCYEYSGDPFFQDSARNQVRSFEERLNQNNGLDHHDIGFLYSLSAVAQWNIEQDESAKALALRAADHFRKRWRPKGRYIQAWGPEGDPKNGGRIIIDCLMNLPLLYWAYEATGDATFRDIADQHAHKSQRFLVRGDDSSYHTFYFDQENGLPIRGGTAQGYHDGSTWTRGQAWGIYGFALSYSYTNNPSYLETADRLAKYFVEHLPEDHVAYWDFDAPVENGTKRDSSASAIAACGMLEIIRHLEADHPDRDYYEQAVHRSMESLVRNYSTIGEPDAEGLIKHGSYSVPDGGATDDYMIWGDYCYMEALLRMEKGLNGYW